MFLKTILFSEIFTLVGFNIQEVSCKSLICAGWAGGGSKHEEEATPCIHASPNQLHNCIVMDLGRVKALLVSKTGSVGDLNVVRIPSNQYQL